MKDNVFWKAIAEPGSILLLGAAAALASATDLKSGLIVGLIALALLIVLTALAMALRSVITSSFRLPVFAVLAVALCSAARMKLHASVPQTYGTMGIYITLLGLAVAFFAVAQTEAEHKFGRAMGNAVKAALIFLLAVVLTAFVCEFFGSGTVMGTQIDFMDGFKNSILSHPAGRIMIYGLVAGLCGLICRKKEQTK